MESLGGLSAVIIVVNGTTGRLTLNLRNVIARLRGNLPDIVMDNVIVVMTNAKRHEANFNISSLQLHGTVYPYYMQNSAFSQDSLKWDQAALDALQFDWDASMDELRRMVETIDTFKTKSVTAFKDMKDIRNAIKALMHEARLEVSRIQKMQDELAAFEHALKQYKTDEVTYKDYTRERVVETKELIDAKYHSSKFPAELRLANASSFLTSRVSQMRSRVPRQVRPARDHHSWQSHLPTLLGDVTRRSMLRLSGQLSLHRTLPRTQDDESQTATAARCAARYQGQVRARLAKHGRFPVAHHNDARGEENARVRLEAEARGDQAQVRRAATHLQRLQFGTGTARVDRSAESGSDDAEKHRSETAGRRVHS